jgi:hypothetical protein
MRRLKKHWRRWVLVGIAMDCVALLFSHRLFGASNATIATVRSIESLDGSSLDADGSANGIFTVAGNLTLAPGGRITCGRATSEVGPCAVRIATGGNLEMLAGSAIGSGNGNGAGPIEIAVGGNFTMRGGNGRAAGARITAGDAASSGGAVDIYVIGKATTEAGSSISSDAVAEGGQIAITAAATDIRGSVSARAERPGAIALANTSDSPRS